MNKQQAEITLPVGSKVLVTTDNWFIAPDGKLYRGVYGTLIGIYTDDILGVKTNHRSTNWYVQVGRMMVAGCQVHYAIRVDNEEEFTAKDTVTTLENGVAQLRDGIIYNAGDNT